MRICLDFLGKKKDLNLLSLTEYVAFDKEMVKEDIFIQNRLIGTRLGLACYYW